MVSAAIVAEHTAHIGVKDAHMPGRRGKHGALNTWLATYQELT